MADEEPDLDDLIGDEPTPRGRKAKAAEPEERLHPVLSNEEFLAAKAKAAARVMKEKKAAAAKAVEEEEVSRITFETNAITGVKSQDEMVNFTVDLPLYADKISINGPRGRHYYNGQTYSVQRHIADTLAETQFRMWRHDEQTEGKSIYEQMRTRRQSTINAKTGEMQNAPRAIQ